MRRACNLGPKRLTILADMARSKRRLVPEVVQSSAMDCGPAALKAYVEGHGVSVSYGRLREACQTDVDGTAIETLQAIAVELGSCKSWPRVIHRRPDAGSITWATPAARLQMIAKCVLPFGSRVTAIQGSEPASSRSTRSFGRSTCSTGTTDQCVHHDHQRPSSTVR